MDGIYEPARILTQVIVSRNNEAASHSMSKNTEDPHYRLLFESAPDAILVVDDAGLIRINNAQAEKLMEASSGELLGVNVERLVPLSARKKHVNLRANFVQTTHSRPMGVGLSLHAVKLTGREFPVEISLSRTENELRRAQTLTTLTELALRERDFQSLSDQVVKILLEPLGADLVIIKDRLFKDSDLLIRSVFGDSSELIRRARFTLEDISVEQRSPIMVGDDANSAHSMFPAGVQMGFRSFISAPLFRNGAVVGTLSMASRTAHRFSSEDIAFVEAVTNVISTALERSGAEEKLMDSMRLESLGQLTGGIAHDFNNLLTVISGNLQLLELPGISDQERTRAIAASLRAARSGADLTSKLLAFSRRQTLRPTSVDIERLLISFKELLLRTLGAGVRIELFVSPDLPFALVDAGQLESALLNLVVNACDAMPNGGLIKITARFETVIRETLSPASGHLNPGSYVKISIVDTGIGMSKEIADRVFEPFFTTKAVGKGSGLGLSMVYGFAKQSAGHVSVESNPGEGSRFDVYLPVVPAQAALTANAQVGMMPRGHGERVLVVEDDEAVLNVAMQFFKALGYQTISAATSAAAIERLEQHPDTVLVFSDVVLGDNETGPEVCKALLALKPTLRVLFTSGYARANLQSQLSMDDKVELLHKPYTLEALAQAIKRALT
jgi:PAS domain S-box-containing protein